MLDFQYWKDFSLLSTILPRYFLTSFASYGLSGHDKKSKTDFQEGHYGGHLGSDLNDFTYL